MSRALDPHRRPRTQPYCGVVVGGSAGGVETLDAILSGLSHDFVLPVLIVQHLHATDDGAFSRHLARFTSRRVVEAFDKCPVELGCVYTAPADYHMLIERNDTIALTVDARVNWSRPSIDVLFESAALAWGAATVGVILSGANSDGARGIEAIHRAGGLCIAQDPRGSESPTMPQAAIDTHGVDRVLSAEGIATELSGLTPRGKGTAT